LEFGLFGDEVPNYRIRVLDEGVILIM
jgi:hypothetical protein